MSSHTIKLAQVALLAFQAQAAITSTGLWTDNDWYDEVTNIGIQNGTPYSNDDTVTQRITAPLTIDGSINGSYLDKANVQLVQSLMSEELWDQFFSHRDSAYNLDNFLKSVAKFPAFCNETNIVDQTLETTCARELSSLFAHWTYASGKNDPSIGETWQQGLSLLRETYCVNNPGVLFCEYKHGGWTEAPWPSSEEAQYYGRGPFQMHWNQDYGKFSNVMGESSYNSKLRFLENPDLVHENGYLAFASALWVYMTPEDPRPSIHDVMTGFFQPNEIDIESGITTGSFGTTINVLAGPGECGQTPENPQAAKRASYFANFLAEFDLEPTDEDAGCSGQLSYFPYNGAGDVPGYWEQDWSGSNGPACKPAVYETQYSIYARDDYKRCVCDLFGEGEADCPLADGLDVEKTIEEFDEIRDNPFEPYDGPSRSFSQIQRELDLIETILLKSIRVLLGTEEIGEDVQELIDEFENIRNNPFDDETEGSQPRTFSQVQRELDLIQTKLIQVIELLIQKQQESEEVVEDDILQ